MASSKLIMPGSLRRAGPDFVAHELTQCGRPVGALGRGDREQSRPQAGVGLSGFWLLQRTQSRSARSTWYRRLCRTRTRQAPGSGKRKSRWTADATDAKKDRRRPLRNTLTIEKASGGTGVRADQTSTRLPPVPVAGRRESACRVGHDLHHSTHLLKVFTLGKAA